MRDIDSSMTNDFKQARRKLVLLYLLIIGSVIGLFSLLVMHQANNSFSYPAIKTNTEIQITAEEAVLRAKTLFPDKVISETEYEIENGMLYFTVSFDDEAEVKVDLLTGATHIPREAEGVIALVTDDFDEMVGWIALLVFLLAALLSVYVAHTTLKPISRNIRAQKQFVSDAAHEFRNPLAALHARIESILHSGAQEFKKVVLDDLLIETKRLIVMSESLLALEKGEQRMREIKPHSLEAIVRSVVGQLEYLIQSKNIQLQSNITTESLNIDQGDIESILYNLTHNAVKFTPQNGTITITWAEKVLRVSDTGIGIAKEDVPHIFNRFYKADTARTKDGSGLGLGHFVVVCLF